MVETEQDPRIERSRRVILEAALEELGAVGYGALTIEGVAARAGVGKSTIYRHWAGKLALVEDAFRTLKAQARVPESGPLRDRVVAFLEQMASLVEESRRFAPSIATSARRGVPTWSTSCVKGCRRVSSPPLPTPTCSPTR
jgi:AcrR family transcriptional regulator